MLWLSSAELRTVHATEAINGRLETLRGNAMGFANTTSYIQRCLIHSSQLKDILTH